MRDLEPYSPIIPASLDAPGNTKPRVIFIQRESTISFESRVYFFPFLFFPFFFWFHFKDEINLARDYVINGRMRSIKDSFPLTILCKFHAILDTLRVKLKIDLETTGNEWQGFRTIFWKLSWTLIERCWLVLSDTTSGKTIFEVLLDT